MFGKFFGKKKEDPIFVQGKLAFANDKLFSDNPYLSHDASDYGASKLWEAGWNAANLTRAKTFSKVPSSISLKFNVSFDEIDNVIIPLQIIVLEGRNIDPRDTKNITNFLRAKCPNCNTQHSPEWLAMISSLICTGETTNVVNMYGTSQNTSCCSKCGSPRLDIELIGLTSSELSALKGDTRFSHLSF